MKMKGVLYGAELDEFSLEQVQDNGQPKTKVTIKVSFPGGFSRDPNGGQGKREYCRLKITTESKYFVERLQALNIPVGKQPQGVQKPQLIIPFKDLYWNLWQGNQGPGVTGYAEIDGEVAWCQMAPRPQRQQQGGFNNNGGGNGYSQQNQQFQQPQQQQFQQPQAGGFQQPQAPMQQPQFQQPQTGGFQQPQQPQGGFQNGGFQQPQQQFPQQQPPGFQTAAQPQAPYPNAQPFQQAPMGSGFTGGPDPFTS